MGHRRAATTHTVLAFFALVIASCATEQGPQPEAVQNYTESEPVKTQGYYLDGPYEEKDYWHQEYVVPYVVPSKGKGHNGHKVHKSEDDLWQKQTVVLKGDFRGPPGEDGDQGPQGPPGGPGEKGPPGPGACSSGKTYVMTSALRENSIAACQAAYPRNVGTACAIAKCVPGEAFLSGSCSTADPTNPVLTSSPLCADQQGNYNRCPAASANIVGWACGSKTTEAEGITASVVCCGQGVEQPSVLVVFADFPEYAADVQSKLDGTGAFSKVDVFDAGLAPAPDVALLKTYDAVLAYTFAYYWADAAALGDNLADYWDASGRVVVAGYALLVESPYGIQGRWLTGNYSLLSILDEINSGFESLSVEEPTSPLVDGVATLDAIGLVTSDPGNGVVVVARLDSSGTPLIVRKEREGRNMVALNMFPPSRDTFNPQAPLWEGDGAEIMRNALLYSS